MNFMKGITASADIDVNINFGSANAVSSVIEKSGEAKTTVIEKTTVIKSEVQGQSNEWTVQIEKFKKENANLRNQLMQVQKVLGSQTKEINQLKQSKATELHMMSTTIQTTSTIKTDQTKMAELQAQINSFIEENKRDDAQIAQQKVQIDQLYIQIHSLEANLDDTLKKSAREVSQWSEKYNALKAKFDTSSGDDVEDNPRKKNSPS